MFSHTLCPNSVHNNLCACLLQDPESNPERIKHLAEVSLIMPGPLVSQKVGAGWP